MPPRFKRVLSRGDLILYGLVILTPTAPYPVYGIVQQVSQGHAALSYLVAMVAMLFTAASYGKMSGAFPSAGSTYTYAQRALNEHVGFLAGWAMMLDYFLIPLLSVIYVALTAERLLPQVPYWVWAALSHCRHYAHQRARHPRHSTRQHGHDDRHVGLRIAVYLAGGALGNWIGGNRRPGIRPWFLSPRIVCAATADARRRHRHALVYRVRCHLDAGRRYAPARAGHCLRDRDRVRVADRYSAW